MSARAKRVSRAASRRKAGVKQRRRVRKGSLPPADPTRADFRRRYIRRFPSIRADLARRAKTIAPAVARTKAARALQARWWRNPGRLDMEGVDTPGSAPSAVLAKRPGQRTVASGSPSRITSAPSIADPRKSYELKWRLVDLDRLITSHTDTFEPDPRFPAELQPRLRDRAASRLKIGKIAKTLSPAALLLDTHQIDQEPMVVGPDLVIESGNGRTMALRLARQEYPERWKEYVRELRARLGDYGLKTADLKGIKHPVLVRERLTKVDRVAFAREANQSAVLQLSPLEQALADAKSLSDRQITRITVRDGQGLDEALIAPANRPLARHFLDVVPENERAALVDRSGHLNLQGRQRLKAALFARVYGGEAGHRLTQAFFESVDPLIRNVEHGLSASLPAVARAEGLVRTGERAKDLAVANDVAAAVDMYARLKRQGLAVEMYLAQKSFVEDGLTDVQRTLLGHLPVIARSPRHVRELLSEYAEAVQRSPRPDQKGLSGMDFQPPGKEETLERIMRRQRENARRRRQGRTSIFGAPGLAGAGAAGAQLGGANLRGRLPTQRQLDRAAR